jgi:c-di-GMP-binding flagellar brake protein YcgR
MDKADKRKYPRLSMNVEVKYEILSSSSLKTPKIGAKNISAGGLCIMILEKIKVGTLLNFEFFLQDSDTPIMATGKVVWVEEFVIYSTETYVSYDCGVEYVDINSQDKEKIDHYVMLNLKEVHPA